MRLMKPSIPLLILIVFAAVLVPARADVRVLASGHTDLSINYTATNNTWDLHVGSDTTGAEYAPTDVVLKVKAAAHTTVPADARFAFLGAAGEPVWILPQAQNEDLLYLGYGGDGIPDGVFTGDQVSVALQGVTGPGDFFSYLVDGLGNPQVLFNTRDGISSNDVAVVQGGGDAHLNWAFTKPGDYVVVLEASGTLVSGGTSTSSGPVSFQFTVGGPPTVLSTGHTDLAIDYSPDAGAWDFHAGSDALELAYDADDVILRVNSDAKTTIPANAKFSFLGNAGDPVWILTQAENEALLYLGYGGDGIPDGVFVGNQVNVVLKSVTGPGDFFSYTVDGFGNPAVTFNSRDDVSSNDVAVVQAGGDAHVNWAFTASGDYTVTLEASGTLVDGGVVASSGPVEFSFTVIAPPVLLVDEHTDLRVLYDSSSTNELLSVVARDENHSINYRTNEVVLVVAESSKVTLPDGTPFGPGGSPMWILPQSQNPGLLYLGLSAEGIPLGAFNGPLQFALKAVSGPGNFFLWQATSGGTLDIQMSSADGIDAADIHNQIVGSHEHFNWGFTTNGLYQLTFQVSGQRVGETTNITSADTTFTFYVLPLPTNIQLDGPRVLPDGRFTFNVVGATNSMIDVLATEDFAQWTTVITNLSIVSTPQQVTVPADLGKPRRFFRVVLK